MGNCCKPFVREEDCEANAMESLPMPRDQGNSSNRISRYSDVQAITSIPTGARDIENEGEQDQCVFRGQGYLPGLGGIPKGSEAALVAAGWPSWMVRYAGEAINGWIPRKEKSFMRLEKIGEGACSHVYRALDLEQRKIVALKQIIFKDLEPETVRLMAREIDILRRLHHPNIINLEGVVASEMSCNFYLVFECMQHDLAGLISDPSLKLTEPQVKCYMKQLLCGLDYCHRQGILHRDIKTSNLMLDHNGHLKIADFGWANFYDPEQVRPLTNQVVTLWYRPPELLLGATCYGSCVDLWSAGCVLAELYAGQPIFPGRTEVEQLHRIFTLCGSPSEDYWSLLQLPSADIFNPEIPYRRRVAEIFEGIPAPALALIETLLSIDPSARQSAVHALNSEFFSSDLSEPLPWKPRESPNCPSSKELNAIVRDEAARRQATGGIKGDIHDVKRKGIAKSQDIPAPHLDVELYLSMLKRRIQDNYWNKKFKPLRVEAPSIIPIELPRPRARNEEISGPQGLHKGASHSVAHRAVREKIGKDMGSIPKISTGADSSTMSSSAGPSRSLKLDNWEDKYASAHQQNDNRHKQSISGFAYGNVRNSYKDPVHLGYHGTSSSNTHYSRPLPAPTRVQGGAIALPTNSLFIGGQASRNKYAQIKKESQQ